MRQTQRLIVLQYPTSLNCETVNIPVEVAAWHSGQIIIIANGPKVITKSITLSASNQWADDFKQIEEWKDDEEQKPIGDEEQGVLELIHDVGPLHHDYYMITIDAPEGEFTYSVWAMASLKSKTKQAGDADYVFDPPEVEDESPEGDKAGE